MSDISTEEIQKRITQFEFRELFRDLGWSSPRGTESFTVRGVVCPAELIAEMKGVAVLLFTYPDQAAFPDSATRARIGRAVEKVHHENIIIFAVNDRSRHTWQVPKRDQGQGKGHFELTYFQGKSSEFIARRIEKLQFQVDDFQKANVVGVANRVTQAFLADKVTGKFFDQFSKKRSHFVKFLSWIQDEAKRDWYCSVLLNRIMFIYFLGAKGFLPEGTAFLKKSLSDNIKQNGPNTFYTQFLLPLSFFGLGERQGSRGRFEQTFKDVLYLNGGLFAVHQVERDLGIDNSAVESGTFSTEISIPDAAFADWFDYFDKWRWTLEEEKVEDEKYISPHILGYIFERYINQKEMGAYYTKDDITGYICRNTIIPRLFDMLAESSDTGQKAVRPLPIGPHPNLLGEGRGISEGEGIARYVYDSVKQTDKLPTETDYEQEQRHRRYEGILEDFDAESIQTIDDFITYNLDIEKLAIDFIRAIQDPQVLHDFYFHGLQKITVLDPTCGSGAFLLAALNILHPLYNAALSRMRFLLGKAAREVPDVANWDAKVPFSDLDLDQNTFKESVERDLGADAVLTAFHDEIARMNDHPSADYFIKKSIIVNNLFGVDIMEEAVEICKLRLFLALIATAPGDDSKPNLGVEPLPDIDFNVLAGNTLVGYTSVEDIDRLWRQVELQSSTLAFEKDHTRLKFLVSEYGQLLAKWRLQQLGEYEKSEVTKDQLNRAAGVVRPELNQDLWRLYRTGKKLDDKARLSDFERSHQPFHWLLEFPQIRAKGGFDVLVGNPPYVEYSYTRKAYQLIGFECLSSGNLYAFIIERCLSVARTASRVGMIIQLSAFCTPRMAPFQDLWFASTQSTHLLFFDDRPGKLFDGLEHIRVAICLGHLGSNAGNLYTTKYIKFPTAFRPHLFPTVTFTQNDAPRLNGAVLKVHDRLEVSIATKLWSSQDRLSDTFDEDERDNWVYYSYGYGYWGKILTHLPFFEGKAGARSTGDKFLYLKNTVDRNVVAAVLNSSLFYWYYINSSDGHNFTKGVIGSFPFARSNERIESLLSRLAEELMSHLLTTKRRKKVRYKTTGLVSYDEYFPAQSRHIIDKIDQALANHFDLTEAELQFIVDYDSKYRMGGASTAAE